MEIIIYPKAKGWVLKEKEGSGKEGEGKENGCYVSFKPILAYA